MNDAILITHPDYTGFNSSPTDGDVKFDPNSGNLMTHIHGQWATINIQPQVELSMFNTEEEAAIRHFITNITKYEEVLQKHFPEDYL